MQAWQWPLLSAQVRVLLTPMIHCATGHAVAWIQHVTPDSVCAPEFRSQATDYEAEIARLTQQVAELEASQQEASAAAAATNTEDEERRQDASRSLTELQQNYERMGQMFQERVQAME